MSNWLSIISCYNVIKQICNLISFKIVPEIEVPLVSLACSQKNSQILSNSVLPKSGEFYDIKVKPLQVNCQKIETAFACMDMSSSCISRYFHSPSTTNKKEYKTDDFGIIFHITRIVTSGSDCLISFICMSRLVPGISCAIICTHKHLFWRKVCFLQHLWPLQCSLHVWLDVVSNHFHHHYPSASSIIMIDTNAELQIRWGIEDVKDNFSYFLKKKYVLTLIRTISVRWF